MTNKQLINLSQAIKACENLRGIKFAYALSKNLKNIQREIEPVNETISKLQKEHAKRDKDGKMIIKDNSIEMKNLEKFNADFDELMKIENKIKLFKIKQSNLPADITAGQLSGIIDLIEE